jgi:hypothetical protein
MLHSFICSNGIYSVPLLPHRHPFSGSCVSQNFNFLRWIIVNSMCWSLLIIYYQSGGVRSIVIWTGLFRHTYGPQQNLLSNLQRSHTRKIYHNNWPKMRNLYV